SVEAGKFDQGTAFTYKARFEVQPEGGDVAYEGFEIVKPPTVADEKMVDEQLETLRKQHARLEAPAAARPAGKGDVVAIDFTLEVDGKDLKDGGGEGVQLELGSGQVLPELDEALLGKSVDDTVDVTAKLAENHPRAELKGKPAVFHVKVKDIKT